MTTDKKVTRRKLSLLELSQVISMRFNTWY